MCNQVFRLISVQLHEPSRRSVVLLLHTNDDTPRQSDAAGWAPGPIAAAQYASINMHGIAPRIKIPGPSRGDGGTMEPPILWSTYSNFRAVSRQNDSGCSST